MTPISPDVLRAAIEILATEGLDDDGVRARLSSFVDDETTAQRLLLWPPEAFGIVLISHEWIIKWPKTFVALDEKGRGIEFPFNREPLFAASIEIAQDMYHYGPRATFSAVALRGAIVNSVSNALKSDKTTLDGFELAVLGMNGIPAELYQLPNKSFWRRLFRAAVHERSSAQRS